MPGDTAGATTRLAATHRLEDARRVTSGLLPTGRRLWLQTLAWLVLVAIVLCIPATTIFRPRPLFVCLNVCAFALLGAYLAQSYLQPLRISAATRRAGRVVSAVLLGATIVGFHALRPRCHLPAWIPVEAVAWATALPVSAAACLLAAALVKDTLVLVVRACAALRRTPPGARRMACRARQLSVVAAAVALLLLCCGMHEALRTPRLREVEIPLAGLPPALEGLRVVQLSDLHVGQTVGAGFLGRVVDKVNSLDADIVVVTGDLIDHRPETTASKLEPLRRLRSRHGVYFVAGNHEQLWGGRRWLPALRALGLEVLENESRNLAVAGARLSVTGILDPWTRHRRGLPEADVTAALRGVPSETSVRVLLAHQASVGAEQRAAASGVDMLLAGHTHGGQIYPGHLLVRRSQRWLAGRFRRHAMWLYVSRGTGYWGPVLRLGAPSEITLLRLTTAHIQMAASAPPPGA